MLRILTDRGIEYCGCADQYDYQLYLAIKDIDHPKTKAMSPQENGICKRFRKTILNEFYRKKLYDSLGELQKDLDGWVTITMIAHIRARCAVVERQWKICSMGKRFGLRKI